VPHEVGTSHLCQQLACVANSSDFVAKKLRCFGDGFLATFDRPARGVRCAGAIRDTVRDLGLEVRSGLHTGEIEILPNDVGGIAFHITARVAQLARPGEVLTSSVLGLHFEDRGRVRALKGAGGRGEDFRSPSVCDRRSAHSRENTQVPGH
jgi:class 3 adenylate cyclase